MVGAGGGEGWTDTSSIAHIVDPATRHRASATRFLLSFRRRRRRRRIPQSSLPAEPTLVTAAETGQPRDQATHAALS